MSNQVDREHVANPPVPTPSRWRGRAVILGALLTGIVVWLLFHRVPSHRRADPALPGSISPPTTSP